MGSSFISSIVVVAICSTTPVVTVLENLPVSSASLGPQGEIYWGLVDGTVGILSRGNTRPKILFDVASLLEAHQGESLPLDVIKMPGGVVAISGWDDGFRVVVGIRSGPWAGILFWNGGRSTILAASRVDNEAPRVGPVLSDTGSEVCWGTHLDNFFRCTNKRTLAVAKYSAIGLVEIAGSAAAKCWLDSHFKVSCVDALDSAPQSFGGTYSHIQFCNGVLYGTGTDKVVRLDPSTGGETAVYAIKSLSLAEVTVCGLLVQRSGETVFLRDGKEDRLPIGGGITFVSASGPEVVYGDLLLRGVKIITCPDSIRPRRKHLRETRER